MNPTDSELLRRYLDERAEDAVAELVHRYVDLAYSAALRQVAGDTHFAEDVVQQVFADFLRKTGALRHRATLSGWFYTSAHYEAAKVVRREQRRKIREREASTMNETDYNSEPETDWNRLRPVLDYAMHELSERDRNTVLLRFFERLPLMEVGGRLGISENAASKAVERALERLRSCLARRGITSTAGALTAVLADRAIMAAPIGMASTVTTSLLAADLTLIGGATFLPLMLKKSAFVVVAILVLTLGGVAYYKSIKVRALHAQVAQLRMDNLPVDPRRSQAIAPDATARTQDAPNQPSAIPNADGNANEEIRNAGRATPEAAYVTFYWAIENGDVKLLVEDTAHDDQAKGIFKRVFNELSPNARVFYGNPEIMVAAVGCYMNTKRVSQLEIVDSKANGPDAVMLSYRRNGEPQIRSIPLVRAEDGWKVVGRGALYMDKGRTGDLYSAAAELATHPTAAASRLKMPAPGH